MRSYGPGNPLVFSHIPKTAGTSLGAALDQVLQPAIAVRGGIDTALFGAYDDANAIAPVLRSGIFLTPEELPQDASLVTAHLAPATTLERYPGADHITVLRVPEVRLLSQWLHSRSLSEFTLRHWGPSAEAFRAGRAPLADYLRNPAVAPSVDNTITRFLAWPHESIGRTKFIAESDDESLVGAALARLDSFAHVNLVENAGFMAEIAHWLGAELPDVQLNERTSVLPRLRPDISTELRGEAGELLAHRCRLDAQVWSHVGARVLPGRDLDSVRREAVGRAVDRYSEMLDRPYDASPLRRGVEGVWEWKSRVRGTNRTR